MAWQLKLKHVPDFRRMQEILDAKIQDAKIEAALFIVRDNADRIGQRIAFDDAAQKPNSPGVAAAKMKRLGHDIPLRDAGLLGQTSSYLINSQPAGGTVVFRPDKVVSIRIGVERDEVVTRLLSRGYRFFGVSQAAREFLSAALARAVAAWKQEVSAGGAGRNLA